MRDSGTLSAAKDITLIEPDHIGLETSVYEYPNGYNVSCHSCYNGSIQVTPSGGVGPYTYAWSDGATTQNRSALGAADALDLELADANGCTQRVERMTLREPERTDWTMSGNAGTDPSTQFLGTTDNKDVVFKANGSESLRLKSNGDIKLGGSLTNFGLLYRDENGMLRSGTLPDHPLSQGTLCRPIEWFNFWKTSGNEFNLLCPDDVPLLGTLDEHPLNIITNGEKRMQVDTEGRILIGDAQPPQNSSLYKLYVEGGIASRDVKVMAGDFPDYVFNKDYPLMPLVEVQRYLSLHGHLPHLPSATEVAANNGYEVGDVQLRLLRTVEELQLYVLQLEQRNDMLEQRVKVLEASQH